MLCLSVAGCIKEKTEIPLVQDPVRKDLSQPEAVLKENLRSTAQIMATLLCDDEIISELKSLSSEARTSNRLYFKDLLCDQEKSQADGFKSLRNSFLQSSAVKAADGLQNLTEYLADNNCYLYCPYPDEFYPEGFEYYTVAPHPVDNDISGPGYFVDASGRMTEIQVSEEYTDNYPVFLIMPGGPADETAGIISGKPVSSKGETVYEVRLAYIRCASYCGGLFEGDLELRVGRGYPNFNSETEVLTGAFTTMIPIIYPRSYAKAAINDWTVHSNGGWYDVNAIWDSNWKVTKTQQCCVAYEYDQTSTLTASATVGYKTDTLSAGLSATVTTTFRGDFLGIVEWDRDWFFATYTNPGPYDQVWNNIVVRKTSDVLKLSMPIRTITW